MTFSQRFEEIRTGFERPFWVANITEIFERLSYYGAFASLALYLQEKLNFSTEQTGTLTGLFGGMVWFLAIFGGAAADRLGFRRALSMAYLILAAAYFLIGSIGASWLAPVRNAVPLGLFVGAILILPALGISLVNLAWWAPRRALPRRTSAPSAIRFITLWSMLEEPLGRISLPGPIAIWASKMFTGLRRSVCSRCSLW